MRRKCLCLLLALLLLCGCAGSGTESPEDELPTGADAVGGTELVTKPALDRVFTLNFAPEPGINPIRPKSATNLQFFSLIYDTIFTVDEDFSVSSEIITEYKTEDYVWWVFQVNPDITFSDGTPMTAKDVAYSIRMALQSEYYASHLRCIYGASTLNDNSFAITAAQANSQLPAMLNIPIIPYGSLNDLYPLGTGAYVLNEAHDRLVPNPNYRHPEELPIEEIFLKDYMEPTERIAAFEDGRLDLVTNDPTGMYNLGYGSVKETRYIDTTNMHFLGFNTRSNYFQFNGTRCAVARLMDRDYVVRSLMKNCGDIAVLPVHPRSGLYDTNLAGMFGYDPEMAMALFREAGVEDLDDDGEYEILVTGIVVEINIKFIVNTDSAVKVQAARRLTQELNNLGITTSLYELEWEEYMYALNSGDFDMYYGELRLGADWNLGNLFRIPSEADRKEGYWYMNYARTTDQTFTDLYAAYLGAPESERKERFLDAARYICESGFIVPICFERREVLTRRGAITGMHPTQYDLFNRFREWTINP